MPASREVVLENVRKYRAIASLYRQTATFRPRQSCSLLDHAREWENLALTALESYFVPATPGHDQQPRDIRCTHARWETMAAA
jgi:hypothetical protein